MILRRVNSRFLVIIFTFCAFSGTIGLRRTFTTNETQAASFESPRHNNKTHATAVNISSRIFKFNLIPTSFLDPNERRRRLAFVNNTNGYHNNIYSTIPDRDDPAHEENRNLQHFHSLRHLSRYEQKYRTSNDLDLDYNWNGIYNFSHTLEQRRLHQSGQYNHFQSVALNQGYGTHYCSAWVGSPVPQRKTVIVDTGSHYTAFPCLGCKKCGGIHHTDPYFDPSKSTTFHQLQCDECKDGILCENSVCKFSQSYTEGSSWEAIQVKDRFFCGGADIVDSVDPTDAKYALNFMFGCQVSMTGLFITQLADGIMGMSAHPATLPKQLYDQKMIPKNMFAMCYRRELGTSKRGVSAGSMTIGGVSSNLDTSPMIYAKNMARMGWYTVYVKNIYIRRGGGQSAAYGNDSGQTTIRVQMNSKYFNGGKGVIVDSGTTDTYLNKDAVKEFNRAWKKATGQLYSHQPMKLTDEELRKLPTILVQCHAYSTKKDPALEDDYYSIPGYAGKLDPSSPNDLLIAIPATSYMDYSSITKAYTSRLYFTETAGGVLGSNTMQGHNVVFDWNNGRIGFAESSCTYDKRNIPKVALDDGYDRDCRIGNPVLTRPCVETVEQSLCQNNPTNIALLGQEVWTGVVESSGSDGGLSCPTVATQSAGSKNEDESAIECSGLGFCEERRKCQLSCIDLHNAQKSVSEPQSNARRGCGDSFWSACDIKCLQTRIFSTAYSDGTCREEKRFTRPCHIGACARSDPCRVPYIIHSVLAFRGAMASRWTHITHEVFALSLPRAVSDYQLLDESFSAGDVNVLLVLPWDPEVDSPDAGSFFNVDELNMKEELYGMKVVIEIALYNEAIRNTTATTGREDHYSNNLYNSSNQWQDKAPSPKPCDPEETFHTAKRAQILKNQVFQDKHFLTTLIRNLRTLETTSIENEPNSPFSPLYKNESLIGESRVLSAWTIPTQVDEAINMFGPPRPLWYNILSFFQLISIGILLSMLVSAVWTFFSSFDEQVSDVCRRPHRFFRSLHREYIAVPQDSDETQSFCFDEDSIMGATEMTLHSPSPDKHRGTSPKKRRSTHVSISS